jgi:magnesium transporter
MAVFKRRQRRRRDARIGTPPGTLIHDAAGPPVSYELFRFTSAELHEERGEGLPDTAAVKAEETVSWLNIVGVGDSRSLERIGREFGIHPMVLEDIQTPDQRPKLEDYGDILFLSFRMLQWNGGLNSEQISIILGPGYVLSFQERPGDVFDPIRSRLRENKGRVRRSGADYLAYALLDTVVDTYFLVLENLEEELEQLDEVIDHRRSREVPEQLRRIKGQIIAVRRAVWPLREAADQLQKREIPLMGEELAPFLRDLYDHILRVIDTIEFMRESLTSLTDTYQTALSNSMNGVMKVLTIIATIFIPLTFIAGIYGMNFVHMPELSIPWAYPAVLGFMALVAAVMVLYFRWKRWF